jgi:hypothetical protein
MSRWPRGTLYPQNLALTQLTSGGHSVGIVRLRTQNTEFVCLFLFHHSRALVTWHMSSIVMNTSIPTAGWTDTHATSRSLLLSAVCVSRDNKVSQKIHLIGNCKILRPSGFLSMPIQRGWHRQRLVKAESCIRAGQFQNFPVPTSKALVRQLCTPQKFWSTCYIILHIKFVSITST